MGLKTWRGKSILTAVFFKITITTNLIVFGLGRVVTQTKSRNDQNQVAHGTLLLSFADRPGYAAVLGACTR